MKDSSKEHAKYRQSKEWKEFRLAMIATAGNRCKICGVKKPSSRLQVHHIYPLDYENLDPSRFVVLCARDHDNIETFARRLRGRKANEIAHLDEWMALYGDYLPQYD